MPSQDWRYASEAELRIHKYMDEHPEAMRAYTAMSCAEMQQAYDDLQLEIADCDPRTAPYHACVYLMRQLASLRQRMAAAGCPVPQN